MLAYYNGGGRQAWRYSLHEKSLRGVSLSEVEKQYKNRLAAETKNYVEKVIEMDSLFNKIIINQLPTG